jgi:outer membrane lipoprotein-sorting protein
MTKQSSRFLVVLSFTFGLFPHGAHAQNLSPADILKKVAENYRGVSSFSVVAEKKVELDTDTSGEKYRPGNLEGVVSGGSYESDDILVTLMASSSSKAKLLLKNDNKEILRNSKKEIVVVNDGKVIWTLIPAQHAYSQYPARTEEMQSAVYVLQLGSENISGVDLLAEYKTLIATRFRSISNHGAWVKLQHSKRLKLGKDKKECYVVTIQRPGDDTQKQKLWVDKTEFMVWKSVDTTVFPQDYWADSLRTTVTVTVKQMTLNPSLEEHNFVFTPPDRADRVFLLKISGNNPF